MTDTETTEEEVQADVTPDQPAEEQPAPVETTSETVELRIPKQEEAAEDQVPTLDNAKRLEIGQEWLANDGSLSDETWQYLESQNITRDFVEDYMGVQQELANYRTQDLLNRLGGADAVQKALTWAGQNLDQATQADIDKQLQTGTVDSQENVIRGLMARAGITSNVAKSTVTDTAGEAQGYKNISELHQAQRDPRYQTDANYRREVENKLRASDWKNL